MARNDSKSVDRQKRRRPGHQDPRTRALVMAVQDGEEAALKLLFAIWNPRFLAHAARLSGERDAALDIVQEAWLSMIPSLARLNDPGRFRAWAYRIVTNKSADWVRRRVRERKMMTDLSAEMELGAAAVPDLEALSEAQRLRQLVAVLPFGQRALLVLYYVEGFTVAEIAETLSLKTGTVKSRLHFARQSLRHQFERTDR
ncbi:MAG: RNA polymerase sigma factor [Proteobacteria bacterium]|nr:RNA polymerase sigma factor [Pseudomonadota bacterium]